MPGGMGWAREATREKPPDAGHAPAADAQPELVELDDVPAAVVCAHCGQADCLGECLGLEETTHASKVVAIVPWERPVGGWLARLWSTARLTTVNHAAFFGSLPAGDVGAAAMFALVAELLTVSAHLAFIATLAAFVFPELAAAVRADPRLLSAVIRGAGVTIPAVAGLMVFLHTVNGLALDWGARRRGGRKRLGLRFGLYSCGWDLVTLPLGLLVLAVTAGPGVALKAAPLGVTLPPRAARAYLKGVQNLDDEATVAAGRIATAIMGPVAIGACVAVVVAIVLVVAL